MIKIAIASGKGGTGKTFVATNVFHVLMKKGIDAVLVDCDAEEPNAAAFFETIRSGSVEVTHKVPVINTDACTFCGKCHDYCNYNAIFIIPAMMVIQVIEELCSGCGACSFACLSAITEKPVVLGKVNSFFINGRQKLIEARMKEGVMSPVPVIKAAIRSAGESEIVILDSPPGTSCPFIQTAAAADYVILVTEPTPFGLSDLKQSYETLKKINKPCGVIINRTGFGNYEVNDWLKQNNIPLLMEIPFDREVARICSEGGIVAKELSYYEHQFNVITNWLTNKAKQICNDPDSSN